MNFLRYCHRGICCIAQWWNPVIAGQEVNSRRPKKLLSSSAFKRHWKLKTWEVVMYRLSAVEELRLTKLFRIQGLEPEEMKWHDLLTERTTFTAFIRKDGT